MTVDAGPCTPWPVYWSCDVSSYSPTITGYAVSAASRFMWALSGRRFGTCSVTLRPCRPQCYGNAWPSSSYAYPWSSYGTSMATAAWDSGWWFPVGCSSCSGDCSCAYVPEIRLPGPVSDVTAVKVDGAALPTTSYRLDNNRILVRTDGSDWPRCNNLTLADTAVGTWSVTADVGTAVPDSGRLAVGQLACEILKAVTGEDDCRLPSTVTNLVRQGVSITFPDINALLTEGRTGLYLCDLFLAAENPNRLDQRARVYDVDRPSVRRAGT